MKKILIVAQKPYFKKIIENKFGENECFGFDSLQTIFNINEEIAKIEVGENGCIYVDGSEQNCFAPLKLNFFKDAEKRFVVNTTDKKINTAEYDYILFACDNSTKTLYGIVEYCERNDVPTDKILYKEISCFDECCVDKITEIDDAIHFDDLSVDNFKDFE